MEPLGAAAVAVMVVVVVEVFMVHARRESKKLHQESA
jgi:hypothetical protein